MTDDLIDPGIRLHMGDTEDAGRRASEAMDAYVRILKGLGAPQDMRVACWATYCDGCGTKSQSAATFNESRAASHAAGWATVGVDDFCPECIERECSE